MARPGGQSDWSGSHLPDGPADLAPEGCFNGCGEDEHLFEFALVRDGKVWGRWTLCLECLEWGQQGRSPLDPDPLTLTAA